MIVGVLHGPNLNLLGSREPEIYGRASLREIDERISAAGRELKAEIRSIQSNHEGALIDWVQAQAGEVDGFLVNAAAYTHTSVALADALAASRRPFIEVHLSNVHAREPFRHKSLLAARALGIVSGFGADSYLLALRGLVTHLAGDGRAG